MGCKLSTCSTPQHEERPELPAFAPERVVALLPDDARLAFAGTSTAWRAIASRPALWGSIDLSEHSGVSVVNDALLLALSARAAGQLRSFNVSGSMKSVLGYKYVTPQLDPRTVMQVARDNASLAHVSVLGSDAVGEQCQVFDVGFLAHLAAARLEAAPQLQRLDVDVLCPASQVPALLRNEAPFGLARGAFFVFPCILFLSALHSAPPAHRRLR